MPDLRKKKPIALVSDVVSNPTPFCRSNMQTCGVCRASACMFSLYESSTRRPCCSCSTELNLGVFSTTFNHLLISLSPSSLKPQTAPMSLECTHSPWSGDGKSLEPAASFPLVQQYQAGPNQHKFMVILIVTNESTCMRLDQGSSCLILSLKYDEQNLPSPSPIES